MSAAWARGADLAACVRAVLADPDGLPLGRVVPRAASTFVCVEADDPAVAVALPPLIEALAAAGIAGGRITVAAASRPGVARDAAAIRMRLIAAAPGAGCVIHDPDRTHPFTPGRTPGGITVALDDALLEAEALIVLSGADPDAWLGFSSVGRCLVPGFADAATRRALASAFACDPAAGRAECAAAAGLVPVDGSVTWARDADGAWHAWATAGACESAHEAADAVVARARGGARS